MIPPESGSKTPGQEFLQSWFGNLRGDIVGGLVSASVAVPLAMGFGMFAFVALGDEYFADGALAGLVTSFVVSLACVAQGDKSANVYAPRITTTFFLGILLYKLVHSNAVGDSMDLVLTLGILFLIAIFAGAVQWLFGLVKLGTLIKFIPHPVMAGFQNAAAVLLFLVQLGNVMGFDRNTPFMEAIKHVDQAKPLSVFIAFGVIASMLTSKLYLPKVPALLIGLAVGTLGFYGLTLAGFAGDLGPIIGNAPAKLFDTSFLPGLSAFTQGVDVIAYAPTILGGGLALAIIASIDALLCAKLLMRPGDPKVDGDRLLMRLGLSNMLAAACGGFTSGLNLGPSLTNRAFGGRKPLSVVVNAVVSILAFAAFFPVIAYLPRVALSAVIMLVAVQHFDGWTLRTIRQLATGSTPYRRTVTVDLTIVVLVAVLAIVINIVAAVFIGVAIAAVMFLFRMSRSIIRRAYRCRDMRSRKSRPLPEMEVLEKAADAILVFELQGALFFGTAERLASEIATRMTEPTRYIILDLRRITEIDSSGSQILHEINDDVASVGARLALALPQPSECAERLADAGVIAAMTPRYIFKDVDRALEWAEDDLLRSAKVETESGREIALERLSVFEDFSKDELAAIEKHLSRAVYERAQVVFRQGDPGQKLFVIAKGTASAFLHQAGGGDIRLVSFAPGTVFGELAILDKGKRSATVVADVELICYVLSDEDFAGLSTETPSAAIKLLTTLARELSRRLRLANRTIHHLED